MVGGECETEGESTDLVSVCAAGEALVIVCGCYVKVSFKVHVDRTLTNLVGEEVFVYVTTVHPESGYTEGLWVAAEEVNFIVEHRGEGELDDVARLAFFRFEKKFGDDDLCDVPLCF